MPAITWDDGELERFRTFADVQAEFMARPGEP
jgi:hypothetical protein